ncbi:MAG: N-acetylglucosamine-6-phosphate deacetylase [Cyanobacteria bacterium HKST-UBA02]|nr:N-acetylglucosamine-6-phosphate deacetylase [Cyanobacteria bacterium HKST-UBA02]
MPGLVIRNGHVITPLERRFTSLLVEDGHIRALCDNPELPEASQVIDASGCYVTPGLVDLQVNGGPGCDFWADPSPAEVSSLRAHMLERGVTSFLPTLITDEVGHLEKNISFLTGLGAGAASQLEIETELSRMPGIHLEGPCLSPQRPGVHPSQHLARPDPELFEKIVTDAVSMITLAPELDSGGTALAWLREKGKLISLGHSNATYEEAEQAFERGVGMVTHLFNAMPPLHHRAPGAAGAALLDDRVSCCLIADGLHLDPATVEMIFRLKGREKTVLVTDIAHIGTTGGDLVGSSITLDEAVRNIVNWGVSDIGTAIAMASYNPARLLGLSDKIGSLTPGALADIVLWDRKDLSVRTVILGGRVVFGGQPSALSSVS